MISNNIQYDDFWLDNMTIFDWISLENSISCFSGESPLNPEIFPDWSRPTVPTVHRTEWPFGHPLCKPHPKSTWQGTCHKCDVSDVSILNPQTSLRQSCFFGCQQPYYFIVTYSTMFFTSWIHRFWPIPTCFGFALWMIQSLAGDLGPADLRSQDWSRRQSRQLRPQVWRLAWL